MERPIRLKVEVDHSIDPELYLDLMQVDVRKRAARMRSLARRALTGARAVRVAQEETQLASKGRDAGSQANLGLTGGQSVDTMLEWDEGPQ